MTKHTRATPAGVPQRPLTRCGEFVGVVPIGDGRWLTAYFNKAGNWVSSGVHPSRAAAREERAWAYKVHRDWEKQKAKKARERAKRLEPKRVQSTDRPPPPLKVKLSP